MSDMLAEGMATLRAEMKANASKLVKISAAGIEIEVSATKGRTEFRVGDGDGGSFIVRTDRDYIVSPADLVFGGETKVPERGWLVRETVGSVVEVYEVRAPDGEKVYRRDPYGEAYRIHTKLVRREF